MKLFTTHKLPIEECSVGLKNNLLTWKELNPYLEFEYFTDHQMDNWIRTNCSEKSIECFDSLNTGAGRADFYRVRKLFVEGGIWFDADLPPIDLLKESNGLLENVDKHKTVFFVTRLTNEPRFMIMVSHSNNPLFEEFENQVVEETKRFKETRGFVTTMDLTGPKAMHRLMCKHLNYEKISQLKIGDAFKLGDISFIFEKDIVPHSEKKNGAIICYQGYREELSEMKIQHHKAVIAYK